MGVGAHEKRKGVTQFCPSSTQGLGFLSNPKLALGVAEMRRQATKPGSGSGAHGVPTINRLFLSVSAAISDGELQITLLLTMIQVITHTAFRLCRWETPTEKLIESS